MAAHQALPSLGFSRQERWSGLPFPSPTHESESEVAQSCPTLCDPMDCSLPGSSIHGIFQARVLEWVAIALWLTYITFPLPRWGPPRHRGVKDLFKVAQLAVVGKSVHSNFHSLYYLHQGRFHRGFGVCSWKLWDSQVTLVVNNPPANAGDQCWRCKRRAFNPWVKIPWRRTRNPL